MNRLFPLFALFVGIPVVGMAGASVFGQSATIDRIGYLNPNSRSSTATGISPDGQTVVGNSISAATNAATHAFRWTATDGIQDLGAFDSATNPSGANAVSPGGVIVGYSYTNGAQTRGARVAAFGGMQDVPGYGDFTEVYDIADDGNTLVGRSLDQSSTFHAVRWTGPNYGTIADLGTIGNVVGDAFALECSADAAAGYCWNGNTYRACLFRLGQPPQDLGALNGPAGFSAAYGISANGVLVVGQSLLPSGRYHAMYWTSTNGMADLGTVDGVAGDSIAHAVTANGQLIVGSSSNNSRPGGLAALWIAGKPRQLWDVLVNAYKADVTGWTSFDNVIDVSRDGSVLAGTGTYEGAMTAFRVTLRQNRVPTVVPPTPVSVECNGGVNTVVLTAQANDADATDRLTVSWGVDGAIRQTNSNLVPGSNVTFSYNYKDGETPVWMQVSDSKTASEAITKVTVVDTKSPIVVVSADVHVKVDRGEVFASDVKLKRPFVNDVCDPAPKVTNNAKAKYPIGTTKVTWTVKDDAGNVARAVQRVVVKNDPPVANAGSNVTETTTASSVQVKLNGSLSRDPNGQELTYLWKAPGIKFSNPRAVRPRAEFPVGRTRVTLTVTDEAGAKSTDAVVVYIRAAQAARTAATLADASVRESQLNALDSYQRGKGDALSAEGLSLAASASALGAMAGDDLGTDEESPVSSQEMTAYLTLRAMASQQARMAGDRFYESFLVGGDGNALAASMYAYYGSGLNAADLSSSDVHEALVNESEEFDPFRQP